MSTRNATPTPATLPPFGDFIATLLLPHRNVTAWPVRWFVYRKAQSAGARVWFVRSFQNRAEAKQYAIDCERQQHALVPRWMRTEREHYHLGPAPLGMCPIDFFVRVYPLEFTTEVPF